MKLASSHIATAVISVLVSGPTVPIAVSAGKFDTNLQIKKARHGGTRHAQLGYIGHQRPLLTAPADSDHLPATDLIGASTEVKALQLGTAVSGIATQ